MRWIRWTRAAIPFNFVESLGAPKMKGLISLGGVRTPTLSRCDALGSRQGNRRAYLAPSLLVNAIVFLHIYRLLELNMLCDRVAT